MNSPSKRYAEEFSSQLDARPRRTLPGRLGLCAIAVASAAVAAALSFAEFAAPLRSAMRALLVPLREAEVVTVYSSGFVWIALAAIFAAEMLWPASRQHRARPEHVLQDAIHFVLSAVFRVLVLAAYVAALRWLLAQSISGLRFTSLSEWPLWARSALAILLGDFLGWLHHLLRHSVPQFWAFHALHHSQVRLNLLTDARVHPVDRIVAQTVQAVPLFLIADWLPAIVGYVAFHQVYTKFYHANLRLPVPGLGRILVTPESHRVHHSLAPEHQHGNFGVVFSFWDRLFGTAYRGAAPVRSLGVDDDSFPLESGITPRAMARSTWAQLVYPFRGSEP